MADEESTTVAEDTSVDEATNTLTDVETSLEEIEVTPEELGEEIEDTKDEITDTEPSESEKETEDDVTEETNESEDTKESEEDKQKSFNREMAERRIQEKQQREQSLKASQQEYLVEAENDQELAVRQLQIDAYDNKVEANSNKLTNAYERALKDFDILADNTPEIKAEVDAALDAFQAMYVTVDAYGNPSDVRGDLYQHLQSKAESIKKLTGIGARKQVEDKSKEKSKAFTPPSKAPKEPKVDPDLLAFDEEAYR
jgi:DNA repair exonuclease SbcCD ATPase subunit